MNDELFTLLRTSKIFSSIPQRALRKLLPQFEKIELNANEILFYQGDPSDSIEILLEGKLAAILTTATGENKVIGTIEPGQTAGEIGSLSGEPRTTTVKAIKNSTVFKLPSDRLIQLCHQYPAVLFEIINPIVSRSQQLIQLISSEKFKKHVVIAPANKDISLDLLTEKLNGVIEGLTSVVLLSDYDNKLAYASSEEVRVVIENAKSKNIKKIKQKIIYIIKSPHTALAKFAFERAEMVYIVGNDTASIIFDPDIIEEINHFKSTSKVMPEFIFLHYQKKHLPKNTASWLSLAEFGLHHHVRIHHANDFHRLLRFIRGKAVGLVLSGGGTRGWGHLGAMKALIEAGIPVDLIGGVSVGSIVAASFAITETYEGSLGQFHEIIEQSRYTVSWRNLTWPAISLFNAKGLTTVLQKLFSKIDIEDLWIPYFCISTNLAKNSESIHRNGLLWEKIRSSVSIPGVIPPMLLENELHFDGGLLNNLPVDIMRKLVGHRGNVIAVELVGNPQDEHKYDFPPVLTFWQTLLSKVGIKTSYKFPPFIDTFLKSLLVGSSLKAQQNSTLATILVSLDLSHFPMLHSNKKVEAKIIEEGYESTIKQIKNMQRKGKSL